MSTSCAYADIHIVSVCVHIAHMLVLILSGRTYVHYSQYVYTLRTCTHMYVLVAHYICTVLEHLLMKPIGELVWVHVVRTYVK